MNKGVGWVSNPPFARKGKIKKQKAKTVIAAKAAWWVENPPYKENHQDSKGGKCERINIS